MTFHENYSSLFAQLLPSLIKARWNQLTTRKKNPLSESEASSISPIIEAFLKHKVDRYQRNKKSQYNPIIEVEAESYCTVIPVSKPKKSRFEETKSQISDSSPNSLLYRPKELYSEEEVNARIKNATNNLRQEFIKSIEKTLKNIKQQKEIECNQIKIDMRNKFEFTLKKFI
ncbi:17140_t:CDS:1 [Cetraspora pellucida]|uniref:17140_t:CDS:1 n=1 Tax=Cetraspora pellucida TaxID=1433469 RepID=A0A9N9I885_9GLOM|nr:17140_t:CDS:1 [Cetraspora pellucida]